MLITDGTRCRSFALHGIEFIWYTNTIVYLCSRIRQVLLEIIYHGCFSVSVQRLTFRMQVDLRLCSMRDRWSDESAMLHSRRIRSVRIYYSLGVNVMVSPSQPRSDESDLGKRHFVKIEQEQAATTATSNTFRNKEAALTKHTTVKMKSL